MVSELFQTAPFEAENLTEVSLREDFVLLQNQLKPPFPLTIPSPQEYLQLNRAILFGMLVEPHFAKTHFIHLNAIVTDGYKFFVSLLIKIVNESYQKLLESVRVQLMWVTSELIDVSAIGVDNLLTSLMRQITGGVYSNWNLWLCMELLKVLSAKWDWLLEEPSVLTNALFTYLRLLSEHYRLCGSTQLEALKRLEIDFCIRVLKEQFSLCLRIGRDLVRLLQDLVHIPEFRAIWKDLLLNPGEFRVPGFSDISQLYHSRTSSRYLLLRITPEMENQLRFLLTHVKLGRQKRYQLWFARKFLCTPERETIICDLVRFICCAHHPPNEILQSDVVPRWAVIGWLLTCCRKNHVEANVKLALLYDWLFFDENIDNIMNIEPAILLMVNSIPQYVDITCNLLEFLFLLMDNYDVKREDVISQGVSSAFCNLVKKGVVHSLDALISCSKLSPLLKERLANIFPRVESGVSKAHPPCLPCGSVSSLNLPSPSITEKQASVSSKQRTLFCVPCGSTPPLNFPTSSSMEWQTSVSSKQSSPISVPCGSLPPSNLPGPSSTEKLTLISNEQKTPTCVPSGSLAPLNLPSPSSSGMQISMSGEQRTPFCVPCASISPLNFPSSSSMKRQSSVSSKQGTPTSVPRVSLPPFNLPSPSSMEKQTLISSEQKTPTCVPSGSLAPLNLPSPSSSGMQISMSGEQRTPFCVPCASISPLNFPSSSSMKRQSSVSSKQGTPTSVPRGSLPPFNLPSPSSMEKQTLISSEQKTLTCVPCGSLPPLNLPSPSSLDMQILVSSEQRTSICVPCASVPPMNFPRPSSSERQTSVPSKQKPLSCDRENKSDDKVAETSISDNPVTSCSEVIPVNGEQFSIMGNLIKKCQENIRQSNEMGLRTLEEIISSFASSSNQILDTAAVDDFDPRVEVLVSQMAESFRLNGYRMFSPLEANYDDEVLSATALVMRAFIFSQNERMQKMFLFWSKNGCPVGARLLSYASRLADEAESLGCSRNARDENSYPKLSYSEMILLRCHTNGFLSFMSGWKEDSLDVNQVDGKLVAKLVESAFAAYRRFLVLLSNTSCKDADTSIAKILFSDLMTCCGWEMKRLKVLFHSMFSHLSDLSVGHENIIKLLIDRFSDKDLVSVQLEIGLKKFSIFGEDTENILHLVKISLNWGFVEQQKFWSLMRLELAVSNVRVDKLVQDFFHLGVLDPNVHSIAIGGLLMLSGSCAPTPELVDVVMSLANDAFQDFSAAILASWSVSNAPMLFNSFAKCLEKVSKKNGHSISSISDGFRVNQSTILKFLNFLDKQGLKSINYLNNTHVNIPEIKAKLSELATTHNSR